MREVSCGPRPPTAQEAGTWSDAGPRESVQIRQASALFVAFCFRMMFDGKIEHRENRSAPSTRGLRRVAVASAADR